MLNNLFEKQRVKADKRASDHILRVGLNQCALVEVDPMPSLPLDHVMWGNPAVNRQFRTSYQSDF